MSKSDVDLGVDSVDTLDAYHFNLNDGGLRFCLNHRISAGKGMIGSDMLLRRDQVEWLRDRLTVLLEETAPVDPAYEAYADASAAAIPATDDEWKNRLVEGGVA